MVINEARDDITVAQLRSVDGGSEFLTSRKPEDPAGIMGTRIGRACPASETSCSATLGPGSRPNLNARRSLDFRSPFGPALPLAPDWPVQHSASGLQEVRRARCTRAIHEFVATIHFHYWRTAHRKSMFSIGSASARALIRELNVRQTHKRTYTQRQKFNNVIGDEKKRHQKISSR